MQTSEQPQPAPDGQNPPQGRLSGTFSSLSVPAYRTLWIGSLFSFMSVQMQFLLRGLLAWDLTEREGALGIVYFAFGLAMLIATPLGGVASDRLRKRSLILWGQAILAAVAVFMGTVVLLDVVAFWMLPLSSIAQGVMFGLTGPARVTFAAQLVGRDRIGNAISLSMLGMNATRVVAPGMAGVLAGYALVGIGGAYLISSAFAVLSFVMVWRLPDPDPVGDSGRSPIGDIVEGVRYVASEPLLARLLLTMFIVVMVAFPYVSFLPALVEGVFELDDLWVGLASTASSLGAVAMAVPVAGIADSPKAGRWFVVSGFCFAAGVALLGFAPGIWSAMAVILLIGGATTGFQSLAGSIAISASLESHQGRVQSLMQLSFAGFGLAGLPLGLLADAVGLRRTLTIMGAVAIAAMAVSTAIEVFGQAKPEDRLLDTAVSKSGAEEVSDGARAADSGRTARSATP